MRVTVVGGGLAGLVAARRALELGFRVTLLEKGDRLGVSFVYSSGYIWSYKDLQTFREEACRRRNSAEAHPTGSGSA